MNELVVVGYPLNHSLSPTMHNAALLSMGLDKEFRYSLHPLLIRRLSAFITSIRTGKITGANITIPYKTQILQYIDEVSDLARGVGSVNTLFRNEGKVVGTNTDVAGVTETLHEHKLSLLGSTAIILGAGGAARAVAFALAGAGAIKIRILNRTLGRAEELARAIRSRDNSEVTVEPIVGFKEFIRDADVVVNCTPVGMNGHSPFQSPLSKALLHQDLIVMDLVYNPLETQLLRDAREVGCKTVEGADILVRQGAESLQIWTGRRAPVEVMRNAVYHALGERAV